MRIAIFAAALLAIACAPSGGDAQNTPGAPVQTGAANTNYPPAFPGQTRAPESRSAFSVTAETIADGLENLWAIEFLPDGRALVTERPGRMRIVGPGGAIGAPIEGLPSIHFAGQAGLLDVALSPTFQTDRMIYWSYTEARPTDGEGANGTSVARARLSNDERRLENAQVIFRQVPAWATNQHFGSRLVWDRDGHLYVTLGERSRPEPRVLAQDLGGLLGKVVRINADGSVPQDNPFVGQAGARPEIWSYGHRNMQGATLHPETGKLWTIEHGPRGGDELNVPQAGKNYGWPVITYGIEYAGPAIGEGIQQREGMEQPIYYWDPVIAPSGMTFYSGAAFPEWRGDLLIGGMRAGLVRLELDGEHVVAEERLLTDIGRVRDVQQAPDGALWLAIEAAEGRIVRVSKAN